MTNKEPTVEIVADRCKGCELCVHNCPKKIITMSTSYNRLGYRHAIAPKEGCIGCAACFYSCPEPGTITVKKTKRSTGKDEKRTH